MKLNIVTGLVLLSISSAIAQYNEKNLRLEDASSKDRYVYANLLLFPVRANDTFLNHHKNTGIYTTLEEALEKKKVVITEHTSQGGQRREAGAEVNKLFIENTSSDTILILSGELIQGGQQDRMIAKDFMLYPKSGKQDVSVYCVEHGRWGGRARGVSVEESGNGYSFLKSGKISNSKVRKAAAVQKDQREVWKEVAATAEENKAESETGTLFAVMQSPKVNEDLKKYTDHFKPLFGDPDIIGVVGVSGDSVLGCDLFATHALFEKHAENLIHSYATEAITSGKTITVTYSQIESYLKKLIADEKNQEKDLEKNGTLLKNRGKKIHMSRF
jgi:hypothetical protein